MNLTSWVGSLKHKVFIIGGLLGLLALYLSGWPVVGIATAQPGPEEPLAFSSGGTISFQGQLTDAGGTPLNGNYNLRFAIYDAPSGGNKKWPAAAYEEHLAAPVSGGLFSVQLGSISSAISAAVFNGGGDHYLQVWVCSSAGVGCTTYDDMGRLPISSGAYAQTLVLPANLQKSSVGTLLVVNNTGNGGAIYGQTVSDVALYGLATSPSGFTYGVYGQSDSTDGRGVHGLAAATSGANYGVYGVSESSDGRAVGGWAKATSGSAVGVYGRSDSLMGSGVYGISTSSANGVGVFGQSDSQTGRGVYGLTNSTSGPAFGVYGVSDSDDGAGVYGKATASNGWTYGVYGYANSDAGVGVFGKTSVLGTGVRGEGNFGVWGVGHTGGVFESAEGTGVEAVSGGLKGVYGETTAPYGSTAGVFGITHSPDGTGVVGKAISTSGNNYGIYGETSSPNGTGVFGWALASSGPAYGSYGRSSSTGGFGVIGFSSATTGTNFGVYGLTNSSSGYAGYFNGRLHTTGNFTASGTKSFVIDHPLDPANQYLYHYSLEGPQPFNLYRGTVTLDGGGSAWVDLPAYFEALNTDFNYLLTPIGAAMPDLHVSSAISGNRFQIAGGAPGMQVSWQVTALRNDPWARDQGILTEAPKPADEIGTYLYPQGYGQPVELGRDAQDQAALEQ